MRDRDFTALRRNLTMLLGNERELWPFPRNPDEWADQQLGLLDLLDDLADVLDERREEVEKSLDAANMRRKRCANPDCERWMLLAETGRPREVCSDVCGKAARAARRAA